VKKNDIVEIVGTCNGAKINEGKAELIARIGIDDVTGKEFWKVRFIQDGFVANRWVG